MRFCSQSSPWARLCHLCTFWRGHLPLAPEREMEAKVLLGALHSVIVTESFRRTSCLYTVITWQTAPALGTTLQFRHFRSLWSLYLFAILNNRFLKGKEQIKTQTLWAFMRHLDRFIGLSAVTEGKELVWGMQGCKSFSTRN